MKILCVTVFVFITIIASSSLSLAYAEPIIYDINDHYIIEEFVSGLNVPTAMTFVGDDILVLEKNTGKVILIQENGDVERAILDLPVSFGDESGLLGITSSSNHVYLYFTESLTGSDKYNIENSREVVYQYNWDGENLTNPILIKEFPIFHNQDSHAGGAMTKGQNNEIYFVIGDQRQHGIYQNIPAETIHETGSIFKIDTEEMNVELFAIGIRNSFGLAVDPVTGYLWDTENGDNYYDEINLVQPGFNSGWKMVMGPVDRLNLDTCAYLYELGIQSCLEWMFNHTGTPQTIPPSFENFEYSEPEFSWWEGIGLTALEFPDKDGFGKYSDWLFAADFHNGRIYKFQLNSDRTGFVFSNPGLTDLISEHTALEISKLLEKFPDIFFESEELLFAIDMPGGISDIEFHNGVMHVVSIFDGSIYKIYPKEPLVSLEQDSNEKGSNAKYKSSREIPDWYKPAQKYVDTNGQFSIEYPNDWDVHILDLNNLKTVFYDNEYNWSTYLTIFSVKENIDTSATDQQLLDNLKKDEQKLCDSYTLEDNGKICYNLRFLSSDIIDLDNGKKAYAVLYKTDHEMSADGVSVSPKFEMIHITSELYDGNYTWHIASVSVESYFENHMYGLVNAITSFTLLNISDSDIIIPAWIKNNAGWWASGIIDDNTFVSGIEWLVSNDVIEIPATAVSGTAESIVPDWVKNTAGWWADNQISDTDFVNAIQYLIKVGIIKVS
jgi:hypothetical protein|tara:strand:- start:425 stop:2593 length:2169 start_codon:yes stop_codon:yes gene_type:complete